MPVLHIFAKISPAKLIIGVTGITSLVYYGIFLLYLKPDWTLLSFLLDDYTRAIMAIHTQCT